MDRQFVGFALSFFFILLGCSQPFSSGFVDTSSTGGTSSTTSSTSSTSSSGGYGGTALTGGGGAGGSGGSVVTGGSGGTVSTGGSGGSPPTITLEWAYWPHPVDEYLCIVGIVDRPVGTDTATPSGQLPIPGCLAPLTTDQSVTCDVGPYEPGTVLHLALNGCQSGGQFLYWNCDAPPASGLNNCKGALTVSVNGSAVATCSDPPSGLCAYETNTYTTHLGYTLTLP